MQLPRELHRGMRGPDVRALKRALKRAGYGKGIVLTGHFGKAVYDDLRAFQHRHGLQADGVLGPATFAKLLACYDKYGRWLVSKAPKQTAESLAFHKLMSAMHYMADHTPGYLLGGGHGIRIATINPLGYTDCSSSVSYVLWKAGLLSGEETTLLSWDFLDWGEPGWGNYFSVMSNGYRGEQSHVWIKLNPLKSGGYWRFDTSPHGDGGRGPHLRRLPRFTTGFWPRHWKGM